MTSTLIGRSAATLLAGACVAWSGAAALADGIVNKVAYLTGTQEVPPTGSPAVGSAVLEIDTCANTVRYHISYSCLSSAETAAHFHGFAAPGANAGVLVALPAGNPKVGVWTYAEPQEASILNGLMYINIHTVAFPGGEIRGQVVSHVARLDPLQETPPIAGLASSGFGLFNVNTDTDTLNYYVSVQSLGSAETAAHIHGIAPHGAAAGVLFPLPAGALKVGAWSYPAALEQQILDGLTYVNVHTVANPGGEIRGQICRILSPLDSQQEVPVNGSPATGVGFYSLDRLNDRFAADISHCGLTAAETAAHIHGFATPGVNAGVLIAYAVGPRKFLVWNYAPAQEIGILQSLTYTNVHTAAFPGGEIRGQIRVPQEPCPQDFNGDGTINLSDLSIILANFGGPGNRCQGDADGDGDVDLSDLSIVLSAFGANCP